MKRALSIVVALGVTVLFLALAARNVRFHDLAVTLENARWRWVPVMVAIGLLDISIRAWRWKILLSRAVPKARAFELFKLEAIGLSLNNVLFARVGELARAFLAAKELGVHVATTLASVAVERALDVSALLALFCGAAALAPEFVPVTLRRAGLLALCGAVGALVVLALAEKPLSPGGAWEKRLRPWPKVHALVAQLAEGAAVLREPGKALACVALSLALWSVDAVYYWAAAASLGIGAAVSYPRSILILSWAGAGAALPAAPGAFGTFEALVKNIVAQFGVEPNAAFAYAVFTHMAGYLTTTIVGMIFLYQVGVSLAEVTSAVQGLKK